VSKIAYRPAQPALLAIACIAFLSCACPRSVLGADHGGGGPHASADKAATTAEAEAFRASSHKRFDDVEYWSKVFDDPARDAWQLPDRVIEELSIDPGDVVADLGAGTGYLAEHLSGAVGPAGRVLAVEIEPSLTAHLRERAENANLDNLTPILASEDDPRLPNRFVDLVVILVTYHHIDHRDTYLQRLLRSLAAGGRIAVIDWLKKPLPIGPPPDHKIERERVVAEMEANGLRLVGEPKILEYQYFLIFEPA
jgi:ubiquinone/menaquinone biosynthesis C-methylase UbiE